MEKINRLVKIVSLALIGGGVLLVVVYYLTDGAVNLALPLVFIMLGGMFFLLVFALSQRWPWAVFLYVPGLILAALGVIFLLNVITKDTQSWAYAWLLILAGAGLGLVLANNQRRYRQEITIAGWGLTLGGITLFALFGAIAGGRFIQIMAPVLLALGGLLLRWLHPEKILPQSLLRRFQAEPSLSKSSVQTSLVEPLSTRELEVLRLVDQGLSNGEIADRLVVAASTVKTHINNIYGKLGVQTRVQAINRARELGLLEE